VPFVFALYVQRRRAHVFFLPSHQIVALCAAFGAAGLLGVGRARWRPARYGRNDDLRSALLLAYPAWRGWDTWPAVDRHEDTRTTRCVLSAHGTRRPNGRCCSAMSTGSSRTASTTTAARASRVTVVRVTDSILTLRSRSRQPRRWARGVRVAMPEISPGPRTGRADIRTRSCLDSALAARWRPRPGRRTSWRACIRIRTHPGYRRPAGGTRFLTGERPSSEREPSYTVIAGVVGQRPVLDRPPTSVASGGRRQRHCPGHPLYLESWPGLPTRSGAQGSPGGRRANGAC